MKNKTLFLMVLCMCVYNLVFSQENQHKCTKQFTASDEIPVKKLNTGDMEIDDFIYKRELIKYFRLAYDMPEFFRTKDLELDISTFNRDLKLWYQQYPDFVDILNLRNYEQMRKYDASCYDLPPVYKKDCSQAEEKAYNKRFNNWMAHHPDVPKLLGDNQEARDKHELEKAAFYSKYYKK